MAEAIVVSALNRKNNRENNSNNNSSSNNTCSCNNIYRNNCSSGDKSNGSKLKYLSAMLWGGSSLLAIEHLYTGELWTTELSAMLEEMATRGVAMAAMVTIVWTITCRIKTKSLILQRQSTLALLGAVLMVLVDIAL